MLQWKNPRLIGLLVILGEPCGGFRELGLAAPHLGLVGPTP